MMQMQGMMQMSMEQGGSKLSASAQEFIPGGGMPNGGAMDAFQAQRDQFRFNVAAAEFTPNSQTVQPNAGFAVQPQMPMQMVAPMFAGGNAPVMMVPVMGGGNMPGGVMMQPQPGAMPIVQQAPMAMMQSGQPGWSPPQQAPNGTHGPQQIQHVIGTTPQMPEQQPAGPPNKAAPGRRLENKSKGIMNRPKGPNPELTNEAPEQAEKGWGPSRKKLVNATMAQHGGSAEQSSDLGRNSKQYPPSQPATPAMPSIAPKQEPTPADSVAASQPSATMQAKTVVANQTSAQPKKEEPEEKPAEEEEKEEEGEPKKPGQMSWADRVRAGAKKAEPPVAKAKTIQKSATAPAEVKKPEEPIAPAPVEERELPAWGPPKKTAEASKAPATEAPADSESAAKPVTDSKADEAKQAAEKIAAEKAAAKAAAEMAAQKEAAEKAAKAVADKAAAAEKAAAEKEAAEKAAAERAAAAEKKAAEQKAAAEKAAAEAASKQAAAASKQAAEASKQAAEEAEAAAQREAASAPAPAEEPEDAPSDEPRNEKEADSKPAKKTWADMIRGNAAAPKQSAKPAPAAVRPTPTASARPTAPAQMTPRPAAADDNAQAKEQPPKKEAEEAETSASGDDENLSRSTAEMTSSAMAQDGVFQAWKDARPKAQSIPENVQAEQSPAVPAAEPVARAEEAPKPAARKKLTNAKLAPVKKQPEPEDEADKADALEAEKAQAEKAAAEKAAAEKLLAEKAEAERKAAEEKAAAEKLAAEKAEAEKAAAEKAAAEKKAAEKKAAEEKVAAEVAAKAAAEKVAAEKAAAEKAAAEKEAAEKAAAEKAEQEAAAAAEKAAAGNKLQLGKPKKQLNMLLKPKAKDDAPKPDEPKPAEESKPEEQPEPETEKPESEKPKSLLQLGGPKKNKPGGGLINLAKVTKGGKKKEEPSSPKTPKEELKKEPFEESDEAKGDAAPKAEVEKAEEEREPSPSDDDSEEAGASTPPERSPSPMESDEFDTRETAPAVSGNSSTRTTPRITYSITQLLEFRSLPHCQSLPDAHDLPAGILRGAERKDAVDADWRAGADRGGLFGKKMGAKPDKQKSREDKYAKGRRDDKPRREQVAMVENSDKSWAAVQKLEKERIAKLAAVGEDDEAAAEVDPEVFNQQVIRGINSILNKLTVEKFDQLYKKLVGEVGMCAENHIVVLTKQLFTKSTTQHHFIEMYTDLCLRLHQHFEENPIIEDAAKVFKKVLLNQCQESFEEYLRPPPGFEELQGEEKYEALVKFKTSMLGNIKFVGNLLVQKMLSSKIIFQCAEQLIEHKTDETLESLSVFLTAIGPLFDNRQWPRYDALCGVFDRVRMMVKDKNNGVSQRIKCLLKDVLDARAANWHGRSKKNEPEGPMKMSDVARQARREEQSGGQTSFRPDRNAQPRRDEPRVEHRGDDEWSHVNVRAKPSKPAWGRTETPAAAPQASSSAFSALGALSKKPSTRTREEEAAKQAKKEAKKAKEAAEAAAEPAADLKVEKTAGSMDLEEWRSKLPAALKEFYASMDMDEAVERLEGLAQDYYEEVLSTYMWAVVEESKAERRVLAFQLLAALFGRAFGPDVLVSTLETYLEEDGGFDDMKVDVPNVGSILKDEGFPALQEVLGDEFPRFKKLLEEK
jgi:hypothetical protein